MRARSLLAFDAWARRAEATTVRTRFEEAISESRELRSEDSSWDNGFALARTLGSFGAWLSSIDRFREAIPPLREGMQLLDACAARDRAASKAPDFARNYRVQARGLCRALWRTKDAGQLEATAKRIHSNRGRDPEILGIALLALDGSLRFVGGERRRQHGERIATLALSWMHEADRRKIAWRASSRIKLLSVLTKHKKIRRLVETAPPR